MPAICTNIGTAAPCGVHRSNPTVRFGGVDYVLPISHEGDIEAPLTEAETIQFLMYGLRWKRQSGVTLAQCLNRVCGIGDEATNVKIYPFFGPGVAITKTNIGTAYVNICPGLNGERTVVDFTGCTEYRLMLHANLVGTGQFGARIVRDSDTTVLHETTNLGAAGERELDSDWQTLPATFQNAGLVYLRAQAKSTTGPDDPVFRSLKLGLR